MRKLFVISSEQIPDMYTGRDPRANPRWRTSPTSSSQQTFVPKDGNITFQSREDKDLFNKDWTLKGGWTATLLASGIYQFVHQDGRKCTTNDLKERRRFGVPSTKHCHTDFWGFPRECTKAFCLRK